MAAARLLHALDEGARVFDECGEVAQIAAQRDDASIWTSAAGGGGYLHESVLQRAVKAPPA